MVRYAVWNVGERREEASAVGEQGTVFLLYIEVLRGITLFIVMPVHVVDSLDQTAPRTWVAAEL